MSYRPAVFGLSVPTGSSCPTKLEKKFPYFGTCVLSSVPMYCYSHGLPASLEGIPPRAASSHSVSQGNRYPSASLFAL